MKQNLTISIVALLALAGCGQVDTAVAPRENVQALELRSFPKQDWRLANNKFFIWRDDMTPEQVSRAVAIGKEIDKLDGSALPLNRRHLELASELTPLKEEFKALNAVLRPIKTQFDKATKLKADAEKAVAVAEKSLKLEKDKPVPTPETVAQLEAELATQKGVVATQTATLEAIAPKKKKAEDDVAAKKAQIDPLQSEMDDLEARQLVIEEAGRQQVDEIMQVVEWYKDQPTSVTFQFQQDGTIAASISGWNMGDDLGPRNYTTNFTDDVKPTMGNVTYTELGGIFEFDVYVYTDEAQTSLRETFHFRISRIKYDYPDGRLFFGGEITRTSADGTIRRGQAKLVDRNN